MPSFTVVWLQMRRGQHWRKFWPTRHDFTGESICCLTLCQKTNTCYCHTYENASGHCACKKKKVEDHSYCVCSLSSWTYPPASTASYFPVPIAIKKREKRLGCENQRRSGWQKEQHGENAKKGEKAENMKALLFKDFFCKSKCSLLICWRVSQGTPMEWNDAIKGM